MKTLFLLLLATCFFDVYSQVEQMETNANDLTAGGSMLRSFDNRYKDIVGYPTLLKTYYPGQVMLTSGVTVNQDSINLDVYNNDLLVKKGKVVMVINKVMVAGFSIRTPTSDMIFTKLRGTEGYDLFYEILVNGKVKLYKRTIKTISGPSVDDGYSTSRTHSIFIQSAKIYVQKENEKLVEIKNKKTLLSQFPNQETSITKFMKENRFSVKDEVELAKVIEYINTI